MKPIDQILELIANNNLSPSELGEIIQCAERLIDAKITRKDHPNIDETRLGFVLDQREDEIYGSSEEIYRDHKGFNDEK